MHFFACLGVIFIYICWRRYVEWGIPHSLVNSFALISIISIIVILYSFIYKNNPFTPYTVYSLFIFLFAYSFIPFNSSNEGLDAYCLLIFFLTILFFIIGIFIGENIKSRFRFLRVTNKSRLFIFNCVVAFSIVVFLLECIKIGFIPIQKILSTDVYSLMNDNAIPILHYFVQAVYIIPIWAHLLYKNKFITKRKRNKIIFISLFIIINYLSRQMWLLSIICIGIMYLYYKRLSIRKLILFSILPLIIFLLLGAIRLATVVRDDRNNVEYLKAYANTQYDANLLEVYIGLYSTNNFTTFKKFVSESDRMEYRGYGVYTFRPLYTILLLNQIKEFDINDRFNSFAALGTYAIEPYLDFGLLGVVIVNLLYGVIVGYIYKRYKQKQYRWIIPWGLMIYCMIMSSFTNYYNTFFIWFIIAVNFFILPIHVPRNKK